MIKISDSKTARDNRDNKDFCNYLAGTASNIYNRITTVATSVLNALGRCLRSVGNGLWTPVSWLGRHIMQIGQSFLNGSERVIRALGTLFYNIITRLATSGKWLATEFLLNPLTAIFRFCARNGGAAYNTLTTIVTSVLNGLGRCLRAVANTLSRPVSWLGRHFMQIGQSFLNGSGRVIRALGTLFYNIITRLATSGKWLATEIIVNPLTAIYRVCARNAHAAYNALTSIATSVLNGLGRCLRAITSTLWRPVSWLGHQIVWGGGHLLRGISWIITKLKDGIVFTGPYFYSGLEHSARAGMTLGRIVWRPIRFTWNLVTTPLVKGAKGIHRYIELRFATAPTENRANRAALPDP